MSRGRRALPAEVKALKGNPGKRRLALDKVGKRAASGVHAKVQIVAPDYLTQEGELKAFRMAFETLPANMARASDVHAVARWATWLNVWVDCKKRLDGKAFWYESESNHGKMYREHPITKQWHRAEAHLIALEDRLGLNVVARNNIVHRLFNMPAPAVGGLFGEDKGDEPDSEAVPPVEPVEPSSPLGFVQQSGKQHSTH